jgi:hypothetical protein
MSASIVSRTVYSAIDKKLVLANDQAGRKLAIGSTWNRIRFGFRMTFDCGGITTNLSGATLRMGMCSGTTNMVGSPICTNFLGYGSAIGGAGFNYYGGACPYILGTGGHWVIKKVGATEGALANSAGGPYMVADVAQRQHYLLEIEKQSPGVYRVAMATNATNPSATDFKYSTLTQAMESNTMAQACVVLNTDGGSHSSWDQSTLTFSEAAGALDTFNIYWSLASRKLEISEVLYARYS